MKITSATHPGCRHEENQDYYRAGRLADDTHWLVLCDGMGGASSGGVASEMAVGFLSESIEKRLPDLLTAEDVKGFLKDAALRCNALILEESRRGQTPVTMGTTMVTAVIRAGMCHVVHAGDSRLYLLQKGNLKLLTHDHSIVQELLDSGKITEEQAYVHPNKNIITSALGVDESIRIDYNEHKLAKGDMLLACSDGLSNMVRDGDLVRILKETSFFDIADQLVKQAVEAGGYDNITAIVMEAD